MNVGFAESTQISPKHVTLYEKKKLLTRKSAPPLCVMNDTPPFSSILSCDAVEELNKRGSQSHPRRMIALDGVIHMSARLGFSACAVCVIPAPPSQTLPRFRDSSCHTRSSSSSSSAVNAERSATTMPPTRPLSTPCRYGYNCTRPDCFYSHPKDMNRDRRKDERALCTFGSGCFRKVMMIRDRGETMH